MIFAYKGVPSDRAPPGGISTSSIFRGPSFAWLGYNSLIGSIEPVLTQYSISYTLISGTYFTITLLNMEPIETQMASLKPQVQAQDAQISQLNAELDLPWVPLETFDLFPRLPPELRYRIWNYSLLAPHVITIGVKRGLPFDTSLVDHSHFEIRAGHKVLVANSVAFIKLHQISALESPALLSVCRESRQLALSDFDICLSTAPSASAVGTRPASEEEGEGGEGQYSYRCIVPRFEITSPGFRFRPAYDTVLLKGDPWGVFEFFSNEDSPELKVDNIQSLAIPFHTFDDIAFESMRIEAQLLTGLKELIVIAREDDEAGRIRQLRSGISRAEVDIPQEIPWGEEEFLAVKVMTEAILFEYVEGSASRGTIREEK
jgi:hypothetical protein